jgi:four helix bundle protein
MSEKGYIELKNLEVYKLARQLSKFGWEIYNTLDWQDKKIMGDQFITSTDSVGANIAEGYSRFHFLEKIKFYYISRASLTESFEHWIDLLLERGKINTDKCNEFTILAKELQVKLNNFINTTYNAKKDNTS